MHQEILRSLDAWENECMPMAQLQTNELAFGQAASSRLISPHLPSPALPFPLPSP